LPIFFQELAMRLRLRSALSCPLVALLVSAVCGLAWGVAAAAPTDIVHVEEDWELAIGEPDANSCGPQVACSMSPFANIADTYFTTEINHRSVPWWAPGGISIHQWCGDWRIRSFDRADRSTMNTNDEIVRWTQLLHVENGVLTFQVKNGTSTTWGNFGYSGMVRLETSWGVNNINSYSPSVSVANSGIGYASNRVQWLRLKEVRATLANGTVVTDTTVHTVHESVSP
jgi:hypothetical protein